MELNCENLFDTVDNPLKQDDDFTPTGAYRWSTARYWLKIKHLGQEILSCGEYSDAIDWPSLVAVSEVENGQVLEDLTEHSALKNGGYGYVVTDSPDERGINVGLLYRKELFELENVVSHGVGEFKGSRPTRDILSVELRMQDGQALNIFAIHLPSKRGGAQAERYRMHVLGVLNNAIDSLLMVNPEAQYIVAGDFNTGDLPKNERWVDISYGLTGTHGAKGSYKYKNLWENLDHIMVSANLSGSSTCWLNDNPALLTEDEDYGGVKIKRNYWGPKWSNGYSDHLPMVAIIDL